MDDAQQHLENFSSGFLHYFHLFSKVFCVLHYSSTIELARIVGASIEIDTKGHPVNVLFPKSSERVTHETHPSLFPILLMLSKMRFENFLPFDIF